MTYFFLGLVLGLAALRVAALFARSSDSRVRSFLRRVLLGAEAGGEDQSAPQIEFLSQQEADAPEFVRVLDEEPAVSLDELKAEVTREDVDAARNATSLEVARVEMRKRIPHKDVADVIALLIRWTPRRHGSEDKYQSSFRSQALKHGYAGRLEEKPRIHWGRDGADPTRVAYPDFVLGDPEAPTRSQVLVELKASFTSSSDVDRAMGQMLRYLLAWKKKGPAVLVVCGDAPPENRFLVRLYINSWREMAKLPVTVYFKRDDVVPADDLAYMPDDVPL